MMYYFILKIALAFEVEIVYIQESFLGNQDISHSGFNFY